MSVVATPSTVKVYPSAPSNPVGAATAAVALSTTSGDTSYTAVSSSTATATVSVTGSNLTVTYVAPLTVAGVPITVTVTGHPSGQTTPVTVYAYGPLALTSFSPGGSVSGSFTAVETGYGGTFTATIDPPLGTLSAATGTGPTFGPVTIAPVSPGNCVVTVTDDHGSAVQFFVTIYAGANAVARPSPLGYPTAGVWFDFLHPDDEGLPSVGEMRGMPVTGAAALRGPQDESTVAWCSGILDQVANFGFGFGDFGTAITTTWAGKSDFFSEEYGDSAPVMVKCVDNVAILISIPTNSQGEQLTFNCIVTADLYSVLASAGQNAVTIASAIAQAVVGSAIVGQAVVGGGTAADTFQVSRAFSQEGSQGRVIQIGFSETSIYTWVTLGYIINSMSAKKAVVP